MVEKEKQTKERADHKAGKARSVSMKFREILEMAEGKEEVPGQSRKPMAGYPEIRQGRQEKEIRNSHIKDEIASEHDFFWRRENLKLVRVKNDRAFFRVEVNLNAVVIPMERFGAGELPARLLNISGGGVAVGTKCQCCTGDRLLMKVQLLLEEEPWNLFCQIVRIEEKGISGFVYGCRLVELGDGEQERLMESIEKLQEQRRC